LKTSKKNVNVVRKIWTQFKRGLKANCEKIMKKSKCICFASSKKNVDVVKNGYIFLQNCGNLLGSL
jgi:hypothetical protein